MLSSDIVAWLLSRFYPAFVQHDRAFRAAPRDLPFDDTGSS
jgi:hypothetical protein